MRENVLLNDLAWSNSNISENSKAKLNIFITEGLPVGWDINRQPYSVATFPLPETLQRTSNTNLAETNLSQLEQEQSEP